MSEMSQLLGISERKVRLIAQEIKSENLENAKNGWLLISGNFGYKITTDFGEIKEYVNRMYSMAMAILKQTSSASKYLTHEKDKEQALLIE